ncbi:MAG: hypothetical protein JSR36_06500 [Proteobacteria bacterium]|nr:hypothetical protein [Pseudomonadota bacterium]
MIEAVYGRTFNFEDGLARVTQGDRVSYVNDTGQAVYSMLFR